MLNPIEQEPKVDVPEGVEERPETLPEKLEKEQQFNVHPTRFTQTVQDDQGNPMIFTPKTKTVTITLPSDQQQLTVWSKGPITSSLTWFGLFWLRMAKKAWHFGWKIVGKPKDSIQ